MGKVFVEYRIFEEQRTNYLHFMRVMQDDAAFEVFEGSDQPDLFVEIWSGLDRTGFEKLKLERTNSLSTKWSDLVGMVAGGSGAIRIWWFEKVI